MIICAECGKEFDRDEKVVRLEIFPEIIALEAEFCSEKCLIGYLMCNYCQYMKYTKTLDYECDQDVCVLNKFPFDKKPEDE